MDQWGEWGDCSVTCGDGFKNRSRDVLQQSSGSVSFFINHHKKNNESKTNNRSREVLQQSSSSVSFLIDNQKKTMNQQQTTGRGRFCNSPVEVELFVQIFGKSSLAKLEAV